MDVCETKVGGAISAMCAIFNELELTEAEVLLVIWTLYVKRLKNSLDLLGDKDE